jgi:hypothetical protein
LDKIHGSKGAELRKIKASMCFFYYRELRKESRSTEMESESERQ